MNPSTVVISSDSSHSSSSDDENVTAGAPSPSRRIAATAAVAASSTFEYSSDSDSSSDDDDDNGSSGSGSSNEDDGGCSAAAAGSKRPRRRMVMDSPSPPPQQSLSVTGSKKPRSMVMDSPSPQPQPQSLSAAGSKRPRRMVMDSPSPPPLQSLSVAATSASVPLASSEDDDDDADCNNAHTLANALLPDSDDDDDDDFVPADDEAEAPTSVQLMSDGPMRQQWEAAGCSYVGPTDDDGLAHGRGVVHFGDGSQTHLSGEFRHGFWPTAGVIKDTLGFCYEGELQGQSMHGTGKLFWTGFDAARDRETSTVYMGTLRNSRFEGAGCFTWPDGSCYTGAWTNGKRSGTGFFMSATGDEYDGEWADDLMHGRGKFTSERGTRVFEGDFVKGFPTTGTLSDVSNVAPAAAAAASDDDDEEAVAGSSSGGGSGSSGTHTSQKVAYDGRSFKFDNPLWFVLPTEFAEDAPRLVSLYSKSAEYKQVYSRFSSSGLRHITGIQRVQNRMLYDQFELYRRSVIAKSVKYKYACGESVDRWLYHCTSATASAGHGSSPLTHILEEGLAPLLSGVKHGQLWGSGIYFGTTAATAVRFAGRHAPGQHAMIICRVVVGETTMGNSGLRMPPENRRAAPGVRYDSMRDDASTMFIVPSAAAAYPAYVVSF